MVAQHVTEITKFMSTQRYRLARSTHANAPRSLVLELPGRLHLVIHLRIANHAVSTPLLCHTQFAKTSSLLSAYLNEREGVEK